MTTLGRGAVGAVAAPVLSRRDVLRALPGRVRRDLQRHDLVLHAAAVTLYGALALVPLLLLSGWLAARLVGEDVVRRLAASVAEALPDALGGGEAAQTLINQSVDVHWLVVLFSTLPASVYGEGLRRTYASLSDVPSDRVTGWRGRLAALPVLAAAPVLLLAVLAITPLLARLGSGGASGTAAGIYLSLNVDWIVISLPLAWSFRFVAPDGPSWRLALVGGFATGAFVSGFLQGFVLFLSLPIDLGAPFGGLIGVGVVTALLLWVWMLHCVVLLGYVATRQAESLRRGG